MNDIFTLQNNLNNNDISGKLTYTNIKEIIPDNYLTKQINFWHDIYKTEWRWRFLKFNNRHVLELSYVNADDCNNRYYCNKFGEWVNNIVVSPEYDKFIDEVYYVYVNS